MWCKSVRSIVSTLFICFSLAHSAKAESLQIEFDALENLVKESNLHAKGARLLQSAAEVERGYLRRSYLPRLSATLGHETYQTGSQDSRNDPKASLDLTLNLYRGGRDTLEDGIRAAEADVAGLDAEQILQFELKKARTAYWHLIAQKESLGLINHSAEQNVKQIRSAKERVDAGLGTSTDILEFEMNKVNLDQAKARAKLEIKKRELELGILLGIAKEISIVTVSELPHQHNDTLLTEPFDPATHPTVKSLVGQGTIASLQADQAERWWKPSLDLFAGHALYPFREREFEEQSEREESLIGAVATFELWDGSQSSTESKRKRLEASGRLAESSQTVVELLAEVENARNELKVAHDIIHSSEGALEIGKRYLEETVDEYTRGVKNSPDVLSALEKNLDLGLRFVDLKLDYQLARTELLGLMGK